MSFSRYPAYKDSRVEWLGEVPEHWPVCALSYRYDVALGKMLDEKRITGEHLAPYLRNVDVQWGRININDLPEMDFHSGEAARYGLAIGDLLVCEGGEVGRAAIWEGALSECYYQKALHRVRPHDKHSDVPNFLFYVLAAAASRSIFEQSEGKSTISHLTAEAFRRYRFPFPSRLEQISIATFLDRETAKIDALVADYRTLIELLQEKRQAVISHAVTKGLDPTVPMKDSGVEWLGVVPEHWSVCSLSYRYQVELGKMLDEKRITGEYLGPYLRNVDVQWGRINTDDLPEMDFRGDDTERYALRVGDLLVCEGGEVGRAAIWKAPIVECYYQKALHRVRPRSPGSDIADFLYFVLLAAASRNIFSESAGKSTIAHLTAEAFRRYRFPFPPIAEQSAIATFLDHETAKIDALITDAQGAITLLQERRTALISAAVTGKIDVRGLVAIPENSLVRSCG